MGVEDGIKEAEFKKSFCLTGHYYKGRPTQWQSLCQLGMLAIWVPTPNHSHHHHLAGIATATPRLANGLDWVGLGLSPLWTQSGGFWILQTL